MNSELSGLIRRSPAEILNWINLQREVNVARTFPWAVLAEHARQMAIAPDAELSQSVEWGRIAVEAYDMSAKSVADRFSADRSAMFLRALLIRRYGLSDSERLLSSELLVSWFESIVDLSPDAVVALAKDWRCLPADRILRLRRVKTAISVLVAACKEDGTPPSADIAALIEQWLPIKSLLP